MQEQAEALRCYNRQSVSWDARADFYQGIVARKPDQARFIRGWLNRVEESRNTALEQDASANEQA
jgi:hypothetical protein